MTRKMLIKQNDEMWVRCLKCQLINITWKPLISINFERNFSKTTEEKNNLLELNDL